MTATIKNKVCNFKQTIESIEINEGKSLNDDMVTCINTNSELCDPDHDHIIIGGPCLINNQN